MDFRAAFSNMKKGIPMKRKKWNDVWYYDKSKKILMGKHDSGKLEELFNIPDTANMTYIFIQFSAENLVRPVGRGCSSSKVYNKYLFCDVERCPRRNKETSPLLCSTMGR